MPAPRKRPRLWLRPPRRDAGGRVVAKATWIILDGGRHIATGCAAGETEAADAALAGYLADKYAPNRRERELGGIAVADVLSIYVDDVGPRQADKAKLLKRVDRLNEFFGGMMLDGITGAACRDYARHRGSPGGARRDLEDLRSAINHHAGEGYHRGVVKVVLPQKGEPRERWLTRQEAARLLWTCWRAREVQTVHRGTLKGQPVETRKRPLRHLARFILIGLYTGTRAGAIATASPVAKEGRSFVDLEHGIYYRLARGRKATNKRQTPAPVPARLLAHLRRWNSMGIAREHFVEWNGAPVKSVKTAMATAVEKAGLDGSVSPHTLRHTAATWMMQNGAEIWQAAGFLGMSEATLRRVYGHHHPEFMRGAADALTRKRQTAHPLVVSLANERTKRLKDASST
ncbi:MAG: site-specific integrase [Bauldia sp.]|nr:MAG: site-specific integrase [Bauldia sp.]